MAVSDQAWVLASGNQGKLKEFQDLFAPWGIAWVAQGELGVPDAEEPFHTFIENALTKARHASRLTGRPALADDSGLCVPALQGAPGVLSARYATLFGREKSDANNNACLVAQLKDITDRRAYFVCAMVWVAHADDPTPTVAQKMWWGEVLDTPQGEHGFGYDPHFWLPEHRCTAAEMPKAQKNLHSHRAQATQALLMELQQRLNLTQVA
ncbi:RdgB/HAM1 family non-canonical purine NTP pyrophosphatase [Limnobacter humi]|uniref:dITP/XTP pyrophosphatase n=1 Tax=Limnobacter humi TaxID=1778671 RepID=A0ABT1WIJ9_9BURK|nr:RdgB/HAM1 family non-canonical purine NTP pyrophosphatase [Limnobacter humi]MCQ8897340.1 RdgB/HAM1 family non-canonical purine NTP pyrophosphatase [Limnobacter humi]